MSYLDQIYSVRNNRPVELYAFFLGDRAWFYTSADENLTVGSRTYLAVGIRRGELQANNETNSFTVDVQVDRELTLPVIFAEGSPPTPVWVMIQQAQRDDLEDSVILFQGQIAAMRSRDQVMEFHCTSMQSALDKLIPRWTYQRTCNHILFDQGCQVDRESFKQLAEVSTIDELELTVDWEDDVYMGQFSLGGFATGGYLQKVSNGQRVMIIEHGSYTGMRLLNALPGLQVGDAIEVFAGCDRTLATCRDKFDNLERFMGFPLIPLRNPFNGLI